MHPEPAEGEGEVGRGGTRVTIFHPAEEMEYGEAVAAGEVTAAATAAAAVVEAVVVVAGGERG